MKWRRNKECEEYEAQISAEAEEAQTRAEERLHQEEERLEKVRGITSDLRTAMKKNHIREAIQYAIREKAGTS